VAESKVLTMKAVVRTPGKKGASKRLRNSGKIPGVYYHGSEDAVHFEIDGHELKILLGQSPTLINLEVEGSESRECMIRDIQRHPVSQEPLHIDLIGITRGVKINATVPVRLVGIPDGVKNQGGILQQAMQQVDILVLPTNLPHSIDVDVSGLELGESIHLRDVVVEDIEWETDPEQTVATVAHPRVVEEETAEGEEAAEGEEGGEEEGSGEESSEDNEE